MMEGFTAPEDFRLTIQKPGHRTIKIVGNWGSGSYFVPMPYVLFYQYLNGPYGLRHMYKDDKNSFLSYEESYESWKTSSSLDFNNNYFNNVFFIKRSRSVVDVLHDANLRVGNVPFSGFSDQQSAQYAWVSCE